ncbi:photoreceptor cilium actin regulator [Cololabis saira]|uniref:photoreceptor cilium actin regulator n=1 Tax=Cololabis saira TaxID=129043 RepID=UPI002AD59C93|nr:photoreceptor cilium actin regulator [Cololabis saira]
MGCSPSKGRLFSKGPQHALLADPTPKALDCNPVQVEDKSTKNEEKEEEGPLLTKENLAQEAARPQLTSTTTISPKKEDFKETEVNLMTKEVLCDDMESGEIKKMEKPKEDKSKIRSTEKQRQSPVVQTKIEFPPHMLRAHEAAYNFLNPNISKYESLMHLFDQAAQSQLSFQPMMSAFLYCFEEINQALDEMAEEGELMLKEHGDYMALPPGKTGQTVVPSKYGTNTVNPIDPSPDLLRQLLYQSAEKMRLVGGSVKTLGDKTLEEAVDYFSSFSKVLVGRLQAKHAAELRLTQVLVQVERAAIRKSNPEDFALHSEDSGIGGENESLTGSERHRRHRGSAGSGSCGSGLNIRGVYDNVTYNLAGLVGHNEDDEEEDEDDEQDEEEYEDGENDRPERKRSSSSPPDPSQALHHMHPNSILYQKLSAQRLMTATETRMRTLSETQGTKEMARPPILHRTLPRRHSFNIGAHKSPVRASRPPGLLPMLGSQKPKRHCVRRLINTFSQGVDGRPGQSLANIPPHIKRPNKSQILLQCGAVSGNEGVSVVNGNNNNNSWPDGREDLDDDSLPPPPPEVLMDYSFQGDEDQPENEKSQEETVRILPVINRKTGNSQRLKMSLQNVEVLPSKANVRPSSIPIPTAQCVSQESGTDDEKLQPETDTDQETEKEKCFYQQAKKIINLRNAVQPSDEQNPIEPKCTAPTALPAIVGQRRESNDLRESELSSGTLVTAPPVSRVRLPPSCPSVRHRFPSPPVLRPQPTSRPSSRPNSPRNIVRSTDNNVEEIIPSVSFRDARSVFCRNEMQNIQPGPFPPGSAVLPRKWGEGSRGRHQTRETDSPTRRTQSEQRPKCQYGPNSSQGQ